MNYKLLITLTLVASVSVQAEQVLKNNSRFLKYEESLFPQNLKLRSLPKYLREDAPPSTELFEEILTHKSQSTSSIPFIPTPLTIDMSQVEVRTLVSQGNPKNRIDLTFLGDGYTEAEKEKFFKDATRLKDDLFTEDTFSSYLPLFNVHAVFIPSQESGITDVARKNTALGLYRDPKGSKRAIMPGNESIIDSALAKAPDTDYPILIANDDYYGGLGGKYAITTRSEDSGSMVLRHELGHNFGQVGEEYDGAYVYSGANSSRSSQNLKWKAWLSPNAEAYETKYLSGSYVWQPLASRPYETEFTFPAANTHGDYSYEILISSVGWETPEDVYIFVDGQKVDYEGVFTKDRSFFKANLNRSLTPGKHKLLVKENIADGDNVLAFVNVYALEGHHNADPTNHAAYATYNIDGRKMGYRPTHDGCLMRNMRIKKFCNADLENFWHQFLKRVVLIDEVKIQTRDDRKWIEVITPNLDDLEIRWFMTSSSGSESELAGYFNRKSWDVDASVSGYKIKVQVLFKTKEVRSFTSAFKAEKEFTL